jgi:hypothetical protein
MNAKGIIGAVLVLIMVVATLVLALQSEQPIQVLGGLSKREIADIRKEVWHMTHPSILPDFSARSFRAAPGLIVQRFGRSNSKIFKMEARNQEFVAVFGRSTADAQAHRYIFWCVFRETNGWRAEAEYHLTDH